jgi:methyl-accepting chemotaxis protein
MKIISRKLNFRFNNKIKLSFNKFLNFKLRGKLLTTYILLFLLFSLTVFTVANTLVRNLATSYETDQLNVAAKTGLSFLNQAYAGDFNLVNGKLYRGDIPLETDTIIVDKISKETGTVSAIFNGNKVVSTSIKDKSGQRVQGMQVSASIKKMVLQNGKEYIGVVTVDNKQYQAKFTPITDSNNKTIGMWFTGVDKSKSKNAIANFDKSIILTTLLFVALGILFIELFIKRLLKNVKVVSDTLKHMGEGNLDFQCEVKTNDEIKDIADSVNLSIKNIKNLIGNIINMTEALTETSASISDTSEGFGFSSNEISAAVAEVSEGAFSQAEEIKECGHTIELLARNINEMEAQSSNTISDMEIMKNCNQVGLEALDN